MHRRTEQHQGQPEVEKVAMVTTSVYSLLGNLSIKGHFGGIGHEKGGSPALNSACSA